MKKEYLEPQVELVTFDVEDVITASVAAISSDEDETPVVFIQGN